VEAHAADLEAEEAVVIVEDEEDLVEVAAEAVIVEGVVDSEDAVEVVAELEVVAVVELEVEAVVLVVVVELEVVVPRSSWSPTDILEFSLPRARRRPSSHSTAFQERPSMVRRGSQ